MNCWNYSGLHVSLEYGRRKCIDLQNFERDTFWEFSTSKAEKKMEGNKGNNMRGWKVNRTGSGSRPVSEFSSLLPECNQWLLVL